MSFFGTWIQRVLDDFSFVDGSEFLASIKAVKHEVGICSQGMRREKNNNETQYQNSDLPDFPKKSFLSKFEPAARNRSWLRLDWSS
jgi:hypothetical protein